MFCWFDYILVSFIVILSFKTNQLKFGVFYRSGNNPTSVNVLPWIFIVKFGSCFLEKAKAARVTTSRGISIKSCSHGVWEACWTRSAWRPEGTAAVQICSNRNQEKSLNSLLEPSNKLKINHWQWFMYNTIWGVLCFTLFSLRVHTSEYNRLWWESFSLSD